LFPNPTKGNISIPIPKELLYKEALVNVLNVEGKVVYSTAVSNKEIIQLQLDLPNGIYAVSIIGNEQNYLSKFIINR
jgi:hypothetical protein